MFWRTVVRNSGEYTRVSDQGPWARVEEMVADTSRKLATGASWSGHERNHLFVGGLPGFQFERLSGLSGLDDPGDSRAFATLDFDHDGWLDVVLGNVSAPRTRLLRNEIGERKGSAGNRFIAIQLVGGNTQPTSSSEWSSRDGLGSRVELEFRDGRKITREHRLDDGFKAQNSATMLIGIGKEESVAAVRVRWLSGRVQSIAKIPSGTRLTIYEDESASPTGQSFVLEPYLRVAGESKTKPASKSAWKRQFFPSEPSSEKVALGGEDLISERPALVLYVGMATWCAACVEEIPELAELRQRFGQDELAMIGVPTDEADTPDMLMGWMEKSGAPYRLLTEISDQEREAFKAVTESELRQADRLPFALVTNASGDVLLATWGVPSLSDLRQLLWRL